MLGIIKFLFKHSHSLIQSVIVFDTITNDREQRFDNIGYLLILFFVKFTLFIEIIDRLVAELDIHVYYVLIVAHFFCASYTFFYFYIIIIEQFEFWGCLHVHN